MLAAVAAAPSAAAHDAAVQVTATQCDAPVQDERTREGFLHEWVELTNLGDHDVHIGGWVIMDDDGNEATLPSRTLEAGESVKLRSGHAEDAEPGMEDDIFLGWGATWNNEGDTIILMSGSVEVDREECGGPFDNSPAREPHDEPSRVEPDCIGADDVRVTENSGEGVTLAWPRDASGEDSSVFGVYRSEDGGSFVKVGETEETWFRDTDVVAGETYSYHVVAHSGTLEVDESCSTEEPVTVTVIPFFPGLLGAALAGVGAMAGVLALRRR